MIREEISTALTPQELQDELRKEDIACCDELELPSPENLVVQVKQ